MIKRQVDIYERFSRLSDKVHGYRYDPDWSPLEMAKRMTVFIVLPDAFFWLSHTQGRLSLDGLGYALFADYMMYFLTWWFQYSTEYRKI